MSRGTWRLERDHRRRSFVFSTTGDISSVPRSPKFSLDASVEIPRMSRLGDIYYPVETRKAFTYPKEMTKTKIE